MNNKVLNILQLPEDKTPIHKNLSIKSGIKYAKSKLGVLLLDYKEQRPLDILYNHKMFIKWDSLINDRLKYYTGRKTLAGNLANLSYRAIKPLNKKVSGDEFILDIGCGDGSQLKYLKNKHNYIGIDKNLHRLEILKKRYPEATAIYCDASRLPFKTGSIKYIFSSNAFEHMMYLKEVVLECYRCLAVDGEMIILFPTEGGLWNLGRQLFSKPFFIRKYPSLDFELISHIEHCNNATQILRTLETFFYVKTKYIPIRIPSIYLNALIKAKCHHYKNKDRHFQLK